MVPEQREALDEIVVKMCAGRITRRIFLERAVAIGLTSSVATALLEACCPSSSMTSASKFIVWESEHDDHNIYAPLVDIFNATNPDGIHVIYRNGPFDTVQQHAKITGMLQARNGSVDVLSMDIIWPAEFGNNCWTVPLDNIWSLSERAKYLPGPIEGCTFNDQIWAVPLRTDIGLLYYRTDFNDPPPNTWDELAAKAAVGQRKTRDGYVWQGSKYEGLVCNFVEVLYGYGATVLDEKDSTKVTVNSEEALQALTQMVSWPNGISPTDITTYKESDARVIFQNGNARFMRNWFDACTSVNDPTISEVVGKFDIHALPYGGSNTVGHSCIGGWQLGINAFSRGQDAAWKFIEYMIKPETQKQIALKGSTAVTLKSVYTDSDVALTNPFLSKLGPILLNAKPRPPSRRYQDMTNAIQKRVCEALTKQSSPAQTLKALQSDLERIVSS